MRKTRASDVSLGHCVCGGEKIGNQSLSLDTSKVTAPKQLNHLVIHRVLLCNESQRDHTGLRKRGSSDFKEAQDTLTN